LGHLADLRLEAFFIGFEGCFYIIAISLIWAELMETLVEEVVRIPDEKTLKLLADLKAKLYTSNMSRARKAAHQLSWMQEDGFAILKEALLDRRSDGLKVAAAYGLRKMRGRMKNMAMQVLLEGLGSDSNITRNVCRNTALLLNRRSKKSAASNASAARGGYSRSYGGR